MQVQKVGGANNGRGGEHGGAVKEVRRATGRDRRVRGGCGKDMGGEGPALSRYIVTDSVMCYRDRTI